jgi:hypothetical protein
MEMQIKGVFNVIPLCVRYSQDGETYEAMVFFNVEEGKLIHNIEVPPEFKSSFESKIIEMFGPLKPNAENLPRFDDYVTPDLQTQINSARRGDPAAFDERISEIQNFANREQQ